MPEATVIVPGRLLESLQDLKVPVARVLADAKLSRERFEGGPARLTVPEFFALFLAIEAAGPSADFGLRLGHAKNMHGLDLASLAALHAATVGEALGHYARYKRVCCSEHVTLDRVRGDVHFSFHWEHVAAQLPNVLVDSSFSRVLSVLRLGTGAAVTPKRIELARKNANRAVFEKAYGCRVQFDAPVDRIVFHEDVLALRLRTHNPELLALVVPGLDAELAKVSAPRSVRDALHGILLQRMHGARPSIERAATELHLTPRTLQRRLADEDSSYQAVLDEVRRQTARKLLDSTSLDPVEIAFLLGFEELNSFSRAFHGWEGVTPKQWRNGLRARTESRRGARADSPGRSSGTSGGSRSRAAPSSPR